MSRTAVVTGAGSGIGAAAVQALAADGWSVVLAGRRQAPLEAVAGPVGGLVVPTDVTDEASVRALFDRVVHEHGRLDLLVNNAGTFGPARDLDEQPAGVAGRRRGQPHRRLPVQPPASPA